MSQFCSKVNIKAFRWLELAVIHGSVYFLFFLGGGGRVTKNFLFFVGCTKGDYQIFGIFFKNPLPHGEDSIVINDPNCNKGPKCNINCVLNVI